MGSIKLFDHYSFRARLQPALLTLLPPALGIIAWTGPGVKWESALWTLFGTVGGTFFLGILARNRGKQIEPKLWDSWGGSPTLQVLRHRGIGNPILRERWHKSISALTGKSFPTASEEANTPQLADDIYNAGIKLLIIKTRDIKKYHLLYKENVQYGYCRNLWGMKAMGLPLALLGVLSALAAGFNDAHSGQQKIYPWVCMAANLIFSFWWIFWVNAAWVKIPAMGYAERLMETTENLPKTKKT